MTEIKGVIFDIGGVLAKDLVSWDCDVNLKRIAARETGASRQAVEKAWQACKDPWQTGRMSTPGFYRCLVKRLKVKASTAKLRKTLEQAFEKNVALIPGTVKLIEKLKKKGYQVALLSNTNPTHSRVHFKRGDYRFFKPIILSYRVKCRKPGKKIYLLTVRRMKLKPGECVFIDDKRKNVAGARKAGLKALHFTSPKKLAAGLRELGVKLA